VHREAARGQTQTKGFLVDAEITLEKGLQRAATKMEPEAAPTATQPPEIHHFVFYGQASRDNTAAFAAAKVFFESASGRAAKGGPIAGMPGRCYVAWFIPRAQIAARRVDLGHEFCDAKEARSKFELKVALGSKQSVNMRAAVGHNGRPGPSIFKLTAVDRGIIHCIREPRQGPAMQWKTGRETGASTKHEGGAL
jgi:hypothetical protein